MASAASVNELVGAMANRAAELSICSITTLRSLHPDNVDFNQRFSKQECIDAILIEEFSQAFDVQLDEPITFVTTKVLR